MIFIRPPSLERCRRRAVFGLSVRGLPYAKSLEARYLINRFWEFHHIYNFGTAGYKDELIRFRGQKIKGHQGQSETEYGQTSSLRVNLSPISKMHERILMTLITIT